VGPRAAEWWQREIDDCLSAPGTIGYTLTVTSSTLTTVFNILTMPDADKLLAVPPGAVVT
jgi:hypothetical protein